MTPYIAVPHVNQFMQSLHLQLEARLCRYTAKAGVTYSNVDQQFDSKKGNKIFDKHLGDGQMKAPSLVQ